MSTSMNASETNSVSPVVVGIAVLALLLFVGFLIYRFSQSDKPVAEQVTIPPEARAHLRVPAAPPAPRTGQAP